MPRIEIDVSDEYFGDCGIFVNRGKKADIFEVFVPDFETTIVVSKEQMELLIKNYYHCVLTTRKDSDLGAADNLD